MVTRPGLSDKLASRNGKQGSVPMYTYPPLGLAILPPALTVLATIVFLAMERIFPGRELPHSGSWYPRAIFLNLVQLAITLATARLWFRIFGDLSLFKLSHWHAAPLEGFFGWFVGTFFFYWWHRLRHLNGWWLAFHQIHHSPSRIEILTSFYKHPIEIFVDAVLRRCLVPFARLFHFRGVLV